MPRGVKGTGKDLRSVDEKIADAEKEIEEHKKAITELTKGIRGYKKEKKTEDKEAVRQIAAESGLTAVELKALIDSRNR